MLVHLEDDLLDRGAPFPNRLACAYCKQTHPSKDFGVLDGNAGFGVEQLYLIQSISPLWRFCWRFIPKMIDYNARTIATMIGPQGGKQQKEHWKLETRLLCCHCFYKLEQTDNSCRHCKEQCRMCGYIKQPFYKRHGPERPLESYNNIRFVRRLDKLYELEIRDLNGIRDPRKPPPPEPRVLKFLDIQAEADQHRDAKKSLFHSWRLSRNRFALYSDAEDFTDPFTDRERWQRFALRTREKQMHGGTADLETLSMLVHEL